MKLNLTFQKSISSQVEPKFKQLKDELDKRRVMWDSMPLDKKRDWVTNPKDPIMYGAFTYYQYLHTLFKELDIDA